MPDWGWSLTAMMLTALCLDALLGEPRRGHPLVAFGRLATGLEGWANRGHWRILKGTGCWLLLIAPAVLAAAWLDRWLSGQGWWSWVDDIVVLYLAIGWRSMGQHLAPIETALSGGKPSSAEVEQARAALSMIVSRDTAQMAPQEIVGAAVETTLENSADALFASLFWYALAGPAGVVAHRLTNTLDAMWGYRSPRFNHFGRSAARMDDVLNFLPAQLLALTFVLVCRRPRAVLRCLYRQGWRWKSINAGAVMATGAAALGVTVGGPASYRGRLSRRPTLGEGRTVTVSDLSKARRLVARALGVWLVAPIFVAMVWLL